MVHTVSCIPRCVTKGCPFSSRRATRHAGTFQPNAMTTRTKLKREEDVEREDGRRDSAPPPAPVSQMLDLQRTMGNQAAMAMMARSVRATLAREPGTAEAPQANASISQAIADRDIGAIKAIDDFTPASDPQRFEMIAILLDQFWVGPRDEAA